MINKSYKIIQLDEIDSTNNFAQKFISTNKQADRTIVLADFQFKGKGQYHNLWESEKGKNILMSIILENVRLKVDELFFLNILTSLAIINVLKAKGFEDAKIKWPNDIFIKDKKAGGILIINNIGHEIIKNSIIGIGININQENFGQNLKNATSLKLESGIELNISELVNKIADEFFNLYDNLDFRYLKSKYEENLYKIGQIVELIDPDSNILTAKLVGIKHNGDLIVNLNNRIKDINHSDYRILI